ncbi:MAG: LamG-like jellyroll fold domain-containing protein [Verrucomicrobiae bacterium]
MSAHVAGRKYDALGLDPLVIAYCQRSGATDRRTISAWFKSARSLGLTTNLVGAWVFGAGRNAGTGTTAFDLTNNRYDLTLNNGPTWGASSLDFVRASSQTAAITNAASGGAFNVGSSKLFTVSAWLKCTSSSAQTYAIYKGASGWGVYDIFASYRFSKPGYGQVVSGAATDGDWYHIAAGWDGENSWISLNNAEKLTVGNLGSADTTDDFSIGGFSGSYWGGSIDEVMFWNRALTDAERTWIYNGGVKRI